MFPAGFPSGILPSRYDSVALPTDGIAVPTEGTAVPKAYEPVRRTSVVSR
ncbi:hypothetical protein NSERUTF1_5152 [Nocardia seriolae]|nr:hypothetical protein NSERUTF1_5152 [Nocardia seriolae]